MNRSIPLVFVLVFFVASCLGARADWTMFRSDPSHSGAGTGNPLLTPTLLWKTNVTNVLSIRDWQSWWTWSSPAVVDGILYIGSSFSPSGIYNSTFHPEGDVFAFNATTGTQVWDYVDPSASIDTSPAVANGVVYFGASTPDGYFGALNASNGTLLWKITANDAASSPVIVNGVAYFGTYDNWVGNVRAWNVTNGDQIWNCTTITINGVSGGVGSSPAVVNDVVYVGSDNHNIYALKASNGERIWNYTAEDSILCAPSVVNGVVYFTDTYNVYALNATVGSRFWSYPTVPAYVYESSPAVANGMVYVGTVRGVNSATSEYVGSASVYCLDAANGAKIWNFSTGTDDIASSPAVVDGVVYVLSSYGNLYALNAVNGEKLWSYQTVPGNFVDSSPAVVNSVVYFGSGDGNVYALGTLPISSPSPSIPEFQSWTILSSVLVASILAVLLKRSKFKQKPKRIP